MKEKRGITLIALVVTIVVLLILASVSISMLTGENGIITQAQKSTIKNDNGTVLEGIRLKLSQYLLENEGTYKYDKLQLLANDYIIDENCVVNVEKLLEQRLKTGNGTDNKDVYVIEENHLYYYDKNGQKDDLGNLGDLGSLLAETDPSLFVVSDYGAIHLKDWDKYYYNQLEWTIENVVIPKQVDGITVTAIGGNFFGGIEGYFDSKINLKSVIVTDSVIYIEDHAFRDCKGLTSIKIPDRVMFIGEDAFAGCTSLNNIIISNSLKYIIGNEVFYDTPWYNNQPDGDIYMGELYYGYKGIMPNDTNIIIKEGTKSIAAGAFEGCTNLTDISIPDSVTSIGCAAFAGCTSLTNITIPSSVEFIGPEAFYDTSWYNNQSNGDLYIGEIYYEYKGTMPNNTNIIIKEGTKSIAAGAFYGCTGLTNITIPNSVTSIGDFAFGYCSSLESITIPSSVTSMGYDAFYNWQNSQTINVQFKEDELPSGWDRNWNEGCNAQINYLP